VLEELLGIAFVILQTHLTGVRSQVASLSAMRERSGKAPLSFVPPTPPGKKRPSSRGLLRIDSPNMGGSAFTKVEVLNAVANYWKHREEWNSVDWTKLTGHSKDIADRVLVARMQAGSTGNMRAAAMAFNVVDFHDLAPVRASARDWAQRLIVRAKSEL
jgi:hypothetical protein